MARKPSDVLELLKTTCRLDVVDELEKKIDEKLGNVKLMLLQNISENQAAKPFVRFQFDGQLTNLEIEELQRRYLAQGWCEVVVKNAGKECPGHLLPEGNRDYCSVQLCF